MSSPSILKKLGNKAKGYVDMAKSLPLDDSTIQGLKSSAQNVSGTALAEEPAKDTSTTPADMINPTAKYGSRQGEVRLDSEGNPTKAQPMKVMDDGGDIPMPNSQSAENSAAVAGLTKALNPDEKKPAAGSADVLQVPQASLNNIPQVTGNAAPAMPTMGMPTGASLPPIADKGADIIGGTNTPVADQGIDVNDGQHQLAILKAGEKVLNPEEADAYRAEHDAPQMRPLGKPASQMRTMDEGGNVTATHNGKDVPLPEHEGDTIRETEHVPMGKPSSSLPALPQETKPAKTAPLVYDRGGDVGMRQLGSEYPVLPTPESKGDNILENTQNFDSGGDVGAPTDFGGRVLPNPRGLKPMLDTEIPPPETERISGGAKMNTDNAPLTNPKGDISNPAKTQAIPQAPPEVQAAGQKEAGVQPAQQPAPEVKGTDAERTAIEHDKKMAMGSGNLVKLGTALLNERHLKPMIGEPKVYDSGGDVQLEDKDNTPPEFNQGYRPMVVDTGKPAVQASPQHGVEDTGQLTPEQFNQGRNKGAALPSGTTDTATAPSGLNQGQHAMKQMLPPQEATAPAAPAGGMRQMSTATPPSQDMYQATAGGALRPGTEPTGQGETQGTQRDLAKMEYKAKLADYDQRHQAALDEGTLEGKTKADYIAYAKQAFQSKNPYGSEGNHPGIGGKLLHGLARTGEIAADIAMPGLTQAIPGTPERMAREQRATQGTLEKDVASEAQLDKPSATPSLKEATQGGMIDPAHPELGPQQALFNEKTGEVTFKGPMPPKPGDVKNGPATPEQTKEYSDRIGTLGLSPEASKVYGSAPAGTSPAELDKRYAEAAQLKNMGNAQAEIAVKNQEHADAVAQSKTDKEQARQDKLAGKYFTYTDDTGTHLTTGDKLPDGAEPTPIKDAQSLVGEARTANIIQESMNKLAKDVDDYPQVFDNVKLRSILATATEGEGPKNIGLLVAGTGGSLTAPAGLNKIIDTFLEGHAVQGEDKTALKNYIADYINMKDKAMTLQMEMQNGKIGRGNAQAFQSIVSQIPGGATLDSTTAKRQLKNLQDTQSEMMAKYPETYGNYKKELPYASKTDSPAKAAVGQPPTEPLKPGMKWQQHTGTGQWRQTPIANHAVKVSPDL